MGHPRPGPFSFKTLGLLWPAMGIGPGPKVPTGSNVTPLVAYLALWCRLRIIRLGVKRVLRATIKKSSILSWII